MIAAGARNYATGSVRVGSVAVAESGECSVMSALCQKQTLAGLFDHLVGDGERQRSVLSTAACVPPWSLHEKILEERSSHPSVKGAAAINARYLGYGLFSRGFDPNDSILGSAMRTIKG